MLDFIHFLINFILITSIIAVFLANNPVYSVLYLILSFCMASILAIIFGAEFLGLLFITVYVGAVAVLFLFVIMMINIKKTLNNTSDRGIFIFCVVGPLIFFKIRSIVFSIFSNYHITTLFDKNFDFQYFYFLTPPQLSNTELLGQLLFNVYGHAILIAGFVLLIALIGSIALTIEFKDSKALDAEYQALSRSNTTVYHRK